MSTKTGTIQSYNQLAEHFYERNKDRSAITDNLDRFARYCQPNDLILDIGCGPGFDGELLQQKGLRVIGLDLSRQMIKVAKSRYASPFIQSDMETLPFLPQTDGLWVNASLLHIERARVPKTIAEFARVLKPNGHLFISVKNGAGEKWEPGLENTPRWFTYWQKDQLKQVIQAGGFHVLDIWANDMWIKCCARI